MGLYAIGTPYGLSTYYENQGAYDLNLGTDLMLDLTRYILESDAYLCQLIAFPKGQDIFIEPGESFSGVVQVPPFSYLVNLTGWSGNGNQFTLRIYDKGAQTDLYYGQFAWYPTVISNMTGTFNEGKPIIANDRDIPYSPHFFRSPMIILPPGVLQIQLTNVGTAPILEQLGFVQMLFQFAVPKDTVAMQQRLVLSPTDQTGVSSLQQANAASTMLGLLNS